METKTNKTPTISNIASIPNNNIEKKHSGFTHTLKMRNGKGSIPSLGKLTMTSRHCKMELPS